MIDTSSFAWKKYLTECARSTRYCCVATVDKKGVWTSPVFFAWDDEFNFYFISQIHSRHMQNLREDPRVAVSVYNTEQEGDIVGIQLEGSAQILFDDKKAIKRAFDVYYARAGKGPDIQNYINNPTWIFVRIVPENLYYFDTRFFGEERQEVPHAVYRKKC